MEIFQCFKNNDWRCLAGWSLGNIIWTAIQYIIFGILLKIFWDLLRAFMVSKKILNRNRITLGGYGYGKKNADVFMKIWYSANNYDSIVSECFALGSNQGRCDKKVGSIVENDLLPMGLAKIFETNGVKKVIAIKNFRNRLVFYITKFYLVHFVGDNPKYYSDLKKG